MNNVAIKVEQVSKLYSLGRVGSGSMLRDVEQWIIGKFGKDIRKSKALLNKLDDQKKRDYVWALKDINFEVNQGEIVGIIGRNGAGKSTLLKLLSKITRPTSGRIYLDGRISSLLEIGTGFHPEMTGRENVFMNGTIMGMSRNDILKRFDEIVDFSGIGAYIDTPVKHYSSGMYMRLAFSVAAFLEPDILIMDEVLAVGDAEFTQKSMERMREVNLREGRTVLLVSHSMDNVVSLTKNTLLIENGLLKEYGPSAEVVSNYLSSFDFDPGDFSKYRKSGSHKLSLNKITLMDINRADELDDVSTGQPFTIRMDIKVKVPCRVDISIFFQSSKFHPLFTTKLSDKQDVMTLPAGNHQVFLKMDPVYFRKGKYLATVVITDPDKVDLYDYLIHVPFLEVKRNDKESGFPSDFDQRAGDLFMPLDWNILENREELPSKENNKESTLSKIKYLRK